MKHHMLFGELAQGVPLSTSGQYPFQLFLQSQTCTPHNTSPAPRSHGPSSHGQAYSDWDYKSAAFLTGGIQLFLTTPQKSLRESSLTALLPPAPGHQHQGSLEFCRVSPSKAEGRLGQ